MAQSFDLMLTAVWLPLQHLSVLLGTKTVSAFQATAYPDHKGYHIARLQHKCHISTVPCSPKRLERAFKPHEPQQSIKQDSISWIVLPMMCMVRALQTYASEQVSCPTARQAGQAHSCLTMSVVQCTQCLDVWRQGYVSCRTD